MKILTPTLLVLLFCCSVAHAQMWNGVDSLYGNEWIDFDQSYYKIMVAEDGIYQINQQDLNNAGVPVNGLEGKATTGKQECYPGKVMPVWLFFAQACNNTTGQPPLTS